MAHGNTAHGHLSHASGGQPAGEHMTAMDYASHEATYSNFLGMVKWSVIGLVILMALMGFFLT